MDVRVLPKDGTEARYDDVDELSLIDAESHGRSSNFGITESFQGRKLLICSSNVVAVEVTKT